MGNFLYFPIKLTRSLQMWKPLLPASDCEKSNVEFLQKNIVFLQNELLAKYRIVKSLLEMQTALLVKLAEQKHEWNDQHHATSLRKSNKSFPPDFLQQQEVQKNQAPIK